MSVKPQMMVCCNGGVAPTPTQVATPRTPAQADLAQLAALTAAQPDFPPVAIVGNYAEACWGNDDVGGCVLATNVSGSWAMLDSIRECYNVDDIATVASSISFAIAQQLVSQADLNQV